MRKKGRVRLIAVLMLNFSGSVTIVCLYLYACVAKYLLYKDDELTAERAMHFDSIAVTFFLAIFFIPLCYALIQFKCIARRYSIQIKYK